MRTPWFNPLLQHGGRFAIAVLVVSFFNAPAETQVAPSQATGSTVRLRAREAWLSHGREAMEGNSAALRLRAVQQKMRQRAARTSGQPPANYVVGTSWSPIGPVPLASDASGSGMQDYNYVSGRATSIAVDPNDLGGNTIYIFSGDGKGNFGPGQTINLPGRITAIHVPEAVLLPSQR